MDKLKFLYKSFKIIFFKFLAIYFFVYGVGILFMKEAPYEVVSVLCAILGYLLLNVKVQD